MSSEEVERGKPAPDVYLAAIAALGGRARDRVAIEDSRNGILAAHAAGMRVVAIPNRDFPPSAEAHALASAVLPAISELTPELVEGLSGR